jgi:hypothetical protein
MPLYKCEYCNYSSKLKANFARHNSSKKHRNRLVELGLESEETDHIIQNNPKIIQNNPATIQNNPVNNPKIIQNNPTTIQNVFKCEYCPKTFSLHSNKRRHEIHRCKENPDFVDKIIDAKNYKIKNLQKDKEALQQDKEKLEMEKQELYKQVATLLDKVGDTTNIQNNIILNNYGKEDLSHINDSLKTSLLNMPYCAIPKMIEAIHFNDEKPENKNIVLPNKKDNLVKIFQGDKWIYKNKNETISDLVDSKYSIIDDHYEVMDSQEQVNSQVKTTFTKFRKFYEEGDAEMVEKLKQECELVLLNNR